MGTIVPAIVLCILLPLTLLSVYMDKKSRRMLLSLAAGILACLLAYFVNHTLRGKLGMASAPYTVTVSPVIEELLKFLPILAVTSYYQKGRRGSAALAFPVGVGFCVVENFYYLMNSSESISILWVVMRSVGTGLMHGMSSTILGIGLFYARQEKHMRLQCVSGTLTLAIIYHGLYNLLVQSDTLQAVGIALPVCTYLFLFLFMNRSDLQKLLPEEKEGVRDFRGTDQ